MRGRMGVHGKIPAPAVSLARLHPKTSWGGGKVWGGRGFLTLPTPLGVSQALVAAIILNHLEFLLAEAEGPDRASPCPAGLRAGVHALGWGPP